MKNTMLVALFLAFSITADARASLIHYHFGGVMTSARPSTGVLVGDRFSGTFTYETNDAVPNGSGNGSKSYYFGQYGGFANPPDASGLTIQVNGKTILGAQGGLGMSLTNVSQTNQADYPNGPQSFVGINGLGPSGSSTSAFVQFYNPTASVLPSLSPPTNINLSDFPSSKLYVYGYGNTGSWSNLPVLQGTIDSLTLTSSTSPMTPPPQPASPVPTPEPSTLTALGLGTLAWLWRSRRRRA